MIDLVREQPNSRLRFVRRTLRLTLAAAALVALGACGGGGGGGGSPPPASPPAQPPPANQAPVVTAGEDQTIQLPANSVSLSGEAEDAPGSTLTYEWTSDPSDGVSFADASAAATEVTFTDPGTYTLTLTVSDGELSGSDTLQVTVNPPDGAAPVVNAGADQTAELPHATVSLAGTASGDALTYSWTADPATGVSFADAAAASTTATFSAAGTYVLTLTASDGSLEGSDSLEVIVNPAFYPGADPEDGTHGWTSVTPAEVGMNEARLIEARDYALTGGGAGMVVRHGRQVFAWGDLGERYQMKSTTKSIGGIALGLAIDDGLLSLSDPAQTHLPEIGDSPHTTDDDNNVATGWLDDITVQHLATHAAGFPKGGAYELLFAEPGTNWFYSDGGLNWLADLLTEVYSQDLHAMMTTRVWSVLGLDNNDLRWRENAFRPEPHPLGIARRELASGINANNNAMARVGLLFLRNGMWADDQRIVSEAFVDAVKTPPPENAGLVNSESADFPGATENYGVLWWTNTTGLMADVPTDAYWAWGLGDSLIVVIPSLDLVITRTGANPDDAASPRWRPGWNGDYAVLEPFMTPIVQSVED